MPAVASACMRGCVQDLLIEMQNAEAHSLDYLALASVLVTGAKSSEDAIRLTALRWLASIIKAAKPQLLPAVRQHPAGHPAGARLHPPRHS